MKWLRRMFQFDGLIARYRRANPVSTDDWRQGGLRPSYRGMVVGLAWNDLCGDAWALRQPHNPFNRRHTD